MNNSDYENLLQQLRKDLVPVGSIFAFPSQKVPDGYLPCEGQELPIQLYPELYELIGHTWGGDKSFFCIPDLQGQFIRGWDREGDIDPEREFGKHQCDAIVGHAHKFNPSSIEASVGGDHTHCLYWRQINVRDASTFDINNHTKLTVIPSDEYGQYSWAKYDIKAGTGCHGDHGHPIEKKRDAEPIGNPISTSYGTVRNRVSSETRPTNVALIFCIKVK